MFDIGDKILYPMHGAGVIEKIEEYDKRLCEAVDGFGDDSKSFIDYVFLLVFYYLFLLLR